MLPPSINALHQARGHVRGNSELSSFKVFISFVTVSILIMYLLCFLGNEGGHASYLAHLICYIYLIYLQCIAYSSHYSLVKPNTHFDHYPDMSVTQWDWSVFLDFIHTYIWKLYHLYKGLNPLKQSFKNKTMLWN